MFRIKSILSIVIFLAATGCVEREKKRHIPPDDRSNGPWKYQEQRQRIKEAAKGVTNAQQSQSNPAALK